MGQQTLPDENVNASRVNPFPTVGGYRQLPVNANPYTPGTMDMGMTLPAPTPKDVQDTATGKRTPWKLPNIGMNPDQYRDYVNALKAASYPEYTPIRRVANYAVPNPVFLDPTRAKAAITEQANQSAYNAATSGNGPAGRANALAASGKAGEQIADIEGKYQNENAGIANAANREASGLFNRSWEQQQGYNKDYNEEMANRNKDLYGAHAAFDNEFVKARYEDENKNRNFAWDNAYALENNDPYLAGSRGFPVRSDYWGNFGRRFGTGQPAGNSTDEKAIYDFYKGRGFSDEQAFKLTQDKIKTSRTRYRQSYGPNYTPKQYTESGVEQKYGGSTGKRRVKIVATP